MNYLDQIVRVFRFLDLSEITYAVDGLRKLDGMYALIGRLNDLR